MTHPKHGAITHLTADFAFASYADAAAFITDISVAAESVNHHPNLHLEHACVKGTNVKVPNLIAHLDSDLLPIYL